MQILNSNKSLESANIKVQIIKLLLVVTDINITLGEPPQSWLAKTARGLSSMAEPR